LADFVAEKSLFVLIIGTMMNLIWRLSEYTPDNLGLAFTDDGLLLGRTPLIERRGGRFVVREPSDIARLVKYSFPGGVAVDRLMPGLALIASALNANDQAAARIAAVHLQGLPGPAARNAMVAEDALTREAEAARATGMPTYICAPAHRLIPAGWRRPAVIRTS
jgi:hypothetical protein